MSCIPITLGPWKKSYSEASIYHREHGETTIQTEDAYVVATVERYGDEETDANARLIAAAPEMLEILEAFEAYAHRRNHPLMDVEGDYSSTWSTIQRLGKLLRLTHDLLTRLQKEAKP